MTIYVDKQPENNGDLKRLGSEILKLLDQKVCSSGYNNPNTHGFTLTVDLISPEGEPDSLVIRYDNGMFTEVTYS
jgi:hypothetical protein